jgi:hypothetical protein
MREESYEHKGIQQYRYPRQQIRGEFETSYGQQYKGFSVAPAQPIQATQSSRYVERHYNPEVLRSNYKEAYRPYQIEEPTLAVSRMGSIGVPMQTPSEKY